jgi:hypothetical protein
MDDDFKADLYEAFVGGPPDPFDPFPRKEDAFGLSNEGKFEKACREAWEIRQGWDEETETFKEATT